MTILIIIRLSLLLEISLSEFLSDFRFDYFSIWKEINFLKISKPQISEPELRNSKYIETKISVPEISDLTLVIE